MKSILLALLSFACALTGAAQSPPAQFASRTALIIGISTYSKPEISSLPGVAAVAEFERDLLIERTQSGLARAKSQGKVLGRPRSVDAQASKIVVERLERGEAVAALAREYGTSRQSIMRIRQTSVSTAV